MNNTASIALDAYDAREHRWGILRGFQMVKELGAHLVPLHGLRHDGPPTICRNPCRAPLVPPSLHLVLVLTSSTCQYFRLPLNFAER